MSPGLETMVRMLVTVWGRIIGCSAQGWLYWEAERRGPDLRAPELTLSNRTEILLKGPSWHLQGLSSLM